MADGEMILYTTEDGVVSIQLRTYKGTVWLSQAEIAELFQMTPQNITLHIRAIYHENELSAEATCKELLQVQVVMYLDYAEAQAKRRKTITMREWEKKLDAFLSFNEMDLLNHAGKVSAQVAEALVLERFSEYNRKQIQEERNRADAEDVALLEDLQARIAKEHEKIQKL
jgi:hypothetical protein